MRSVLLAVALGTGSVASDLAGISWADESLPAASVSSLAGKITAIYQTTFQINHKTFSFAPEVEILDRHGDPLQPSDLRVDIEVKYHLLKGTTDKIDRIVLFLPE